MKKNTEQYWYFSRAERRGTLILGLLCLVLFIAPAFFDRLIPCKPIDASGFAQAIEAFADDTVSHKKEASLFYFNPNKLPKDSFILLGLSARTAGSIIRYREKGGYFRRPEDFSRIYNLATADYERLAPYIQIASHAQSRTKAVNTAQSEPARRRLFAFDPNKVNIQNLEEMGIPLWIIKIWINYLNKGGHFYRKEDLLKLYGMDAALYQQLEPYIEITPLPKQAAYKKEDKSPREARRPVEVSINQADLAQWELLDGVGPALAQRIVSFRDKLGGFVHVEQVAETRGLPDSVFQKIKYQLIEEPIFRYLPINTADQAVLQAHPYINPQEARALINYRLQHGPFEDLQHLARIKIWKPERLAKVLPYMKLE